MPIIDFLMDNIFLVMIALFFLSSMLAKKKKADEAEAKKNARSQNPTRVGSVDTSTYDVDSYTQRSQAPKTNPKAEVMKVKEDTIMEAREKRDKLAKASLVSPIYSDDVELSDAIKSSDLSKRSSSSISLNNPSAKEAVKGMMWAEVFGPPRAKKPFRGGSYRK